MRPTTTVTAEWLFSILSSLGWATFIYAVTGNEVLTLISSSAVFLVIFGVVFKWGDL